MRDQFGCRAEGVELPSAADRVLALLGPRPLTAAFAFKMTAVDFNADRRYRRDEG